MPVVQSTYSEHQRVGVAGMVNSQVKYNIVTRLVGAQSPEVPIPFGVAVTKGTNDLDVVPGGALASFLGVSVRDVTLESDQNDQYETAQSLGVLTRGEIFVEVGDASVTAGAAVYYRTADGVFVGTDTGATVEGPIVGAHWVRSGVLGDIVAISLGIQM